MKCPSCKSELKIVLPLPKGELDCGAVRCSCGMSFWRVIRVQDYILNVIECC
jgi:hypothetical protein